MKKTKEKVASGNIVNLWERLELRLKMGDQTANFVTRVEDLAGEKIVVECPVKLAGTLSLSIGQAVEVTVNKKDASYVFEAIVALIDKENENLTTLQPISKAKPIQRRKFVRLDIDGKISFNQLDIGNQNDQIGVKLEQGILLNISAGGILMVAKTEMHEGDYLLLNFRLKKNENLENILGVVKRAEPDQNGYLVGVEFLTRQQLAEKQYRRLAQYLPQAAHYFDNELQRHIVQYIYNQEVRLKKEKLRED
jgi:c-di-GMP-binding flagellar brake protein YcgR